MCNTYLQGAQYISLLNRGVPEPQGNDSFHYLSTVSTMQLPTEQGVPETPDTYSVHNLPTGSTIHLATEQGST